MWTPPIHTLSLYSSSSIPLINIATHRHQHLPWARVTKIKRKTRRIRLPVVRASTKLLMARASIRKSQVSTTLLEVLPLKQLLKITMKKFFDNLHGATTSDNCLNTRYSSGTALCQPSILPTLRSGIGFRRNAIYTGRKRKESQLL